MQFVASIFGDILKVRWDYEGDSVPRLTSKFFVSCDILDDFDDICIFFPNKLYGNSSYGIYFPLNI